MNKTAIKNFAVWARTKLRDDIKIRAGFLGINEDGVATPLPASTPEIKYFEVGSAQPIALSGETLRKRERIVDKLQKKASETDYKTAYDLMIETYASDWFNRFVALRFMEVNERFSDNMRVLSSSNPDRHDPDIVSQPFSSDLEFTDAERADVTEWKAKNETDKLFRFLLIKRCNQLSNVLPGLFEAKGDESELMMRQSFIDKDGMIYRLVNDIDEEDWKDQVQIIGWLYQYYNSELKDETYALTKKGKKISKDRLPSATQLFTPDWIVRYMVENALGHLWVDGRIDKGLDNSDNQIEKGFSWKYFISECEQNASVGEKVNSIRQKYSCLNPEDITFIDPCMGSGHVLVYAFDVLMQIYESLGYTRRDAARSIVENNIYGLDIDERAYQLAYFAVMMKACEYDGRFLQREIMPHVYAIKDSNGVNRNHLKFFGGQLSEIESNNANNQLTGLLDSFIDAKEYGSLLEIDNYDWDLLKSFASDVKYEGQISIETIGIESTQKEIKSIIEIGEVLARKYWVVCTNPPYLGAKKLSPKLLDYLATNYPKEKYDLFAPFMTKCSNLLCDDGIKGMITQQAWMFLPTYETLRKKELMNNVISLVQLGTRAFEEISGEVVQTAVLISRNHKLADYIGTYIMLTDYDSDEKEQHFCDLKCRYYANSDSFSKIKGSPVAYWASEKTYDLFKDSPLLEDYVTTKQGLKSSDDKRFFRLWFEVNSEKIDTEATNLTDAALSSKKWFRLNKGGRVKWYGDYCHLINWENDGKEIKDYAASLYKSATRTITSIDYYFKESISWPKITSEPVFRLIPPGFIFSDAGSAMFYDEKIRYYLLAFLNTKIVTPLTKMINPTVNLGVGDMLKIPFIYDESKIDEINSIVSENIAISKEDWDSFEMSWDFTCHPFIKYGVNSVKEAFELWSKECENRVRCMIDNETRLNEIFIKMYHLEDEITPEVKDDSITLHRGDLERDIQNLISYYIGCLFGRYTLDKSGVVCSSEKLEMELYKKFTPDSDGIIPVTDQRYFVDDIVDRFCEWLVVIFGAKYLEENLIFITNAICVNGAGSRDVLRDYFMNRFFNNHCSDCSIASSGKRPIYWLFDSGKQNGFKALVYMHRYNADTIGRVRISYLHPLQEKYENEVRTIDTMIQSMTDQRQISAEEKRREKLIKQIAEVKEYDERLDHLAQEHIDIDLDDGVKVNYEKIQTDRDGKKYQILAPIK